MKKAVALIAISLLPTVCAAQDKQPQIASLTSSNALLISAKVGAINNTHACQPLKRETVEIIEYRNAADGMHGFNLAKVRVLEGRCVKQEGWIGIEHLESAKR